MGNFPSLLLSQDLWPCQVLSPEQEMEFDADISPEQNDELRRRLAAGENKFLWGDDRNELTYSIHDREDHFGEKRKTVKIIEEAFMMWQNTGMRLTFTRLPNFENADIRITLDPKLPDYSLVGKNSIKNMSTPSMNLGMRKGIRLVTALHEIGHALGLVHEHQRPGVNIEWNWEEVYKFFETRKEAPIKDRKKIDKNIKTRWHSDELKAPYPYDNESVMNYDFPKQCFKKPDVLKNEGIKRKDRLSEIDQKTIRYFYPGNKKPVQKKSLAGQYYLRCAGHNENPNHVYLDGNTGDGKLHLRSNTDYPYTGTLWQLELRDFATQEYSLRCLGHFNNPEHIYLDGNTGEGKLHLRPSTDSPYTGTRWRVEPLSDGSYALRCLGHDKNRKHIYLDGNTGEGKLHLRPNTDSPYTGTHWKLDRVPSMPSGDYTLKCLGDINNPKHVYLDGNTGEGKLHLRPSTGSPYTGTRWRIEQYSDGSYTLRCLGHDKNRNHIYLDGNTGEGKLHLRPNRDGPYTGTRWRIILLSDGNHALACLGHIKNPKHTFLDGNTGEGKLHLRPTIDYPYTGTHWKFEKV